MRINSPVTGREVELADDCQIVSATDLKGRITWANREFIDISGFTMAELQGQAHNIVRHPDMPPEAYADLWSTLKAGRPWVGLVKNRCKNGDHYWVQAHVTPVSANGEVTGYMSVRRKPTPEQVRAAEAAYALFRSKRQGSLEVHRGSLRRRPLRVVAWWTGRSQRARIGEMVMLGSLALLATAALPAPGSIVAAALGAATLVASAFSISRRVDTRLMPAMAAMRGMAEGRYTDHVSIDSDDELGRLLQVMKSMQIRMGFDFADTRRRAAEAQRIRQALDVASTNIMVADDRLDIVYANASLLEMMRAAESDLATVIPGFSADAIVGSSIDIFHRKPEHQRAVLDRLQQAHSAALDVAGHAMSLIVSPVFDAVDASRRIGFVVEWLDRTAEVAVEREVQQVVAAAAAGEFSARIDEAGKHGFLLSLSHGMNQVLENTGEAFSELQAALDALARGDLTYRIDKAFVGGFARMADNANAALATLTALIQRIQSAAQSIGVAAAEIAQGNTDLSSRTESQAASLEETASSMEELTSAVQNNAAAAADASRLSRLASGNATQGGEAMERVVDVMAEIQRSSGRISDIIGLIDGIAFQTNILSLNAAVEAARAGEQGRGFAVVASEVRLLAQRSADAAREIKQLIAAASGSVDQGSALVSEVGSSIERVVKDVCEVNRLVEEIAEACREQGAGIAQVNDTVGHLDGMTQQNAALVEEASAAARSLEQQSVELLGNVSHFRLQAARSPGEARRVRS